MARLTKKLKDQGITQKLLDRAKREGGITLESTGRQTGTNKGGKGKKADKRTAALTSGKRLSRNGKIYYESRKNRSDKVRPGLQGK